jgi:hypothetical protein
LFTNSRVRRRLAVRNPMTIKIALPLDDHRKLEAFVALLAQIDKRNKATCKETKSNKVKSKDAPLGQYRKGSQTRGPFLFFLNKLSCIIDRLIFNLVYAYDRYNSSSSPFRYIHY